MKLDFSHIANVHYVLDQHKAVKLLRKDHAPLIISFGTGAPGAYRDVGA